LFDPETSWGAARAQDGSKEVAHEVQAMPIFVVHVSLHSSDNKKSEIKMISLGLVWNRFRLDL
jgi:hypothetical protein